MTVLAFHPEHNRPFRKDVTGAFQPEAEKWAATHGGTILTIDCRLRVPSIRRSEQVLFELLNFEGAGYDAIGFFCHGLRRSMQMGFNWKDLEQLALGITMASKPDVKVVLYACSCASTDYENFASRLRDALAKRRPESVQVDAHHGSGHCTYRPYVRRFTEPEYSGGRWLVMPGTPIWRKWVQALKEDARFKYPLTSIEEIQSLLD